MGGSADVDRRGRRPRLRAGPEPGRGDQAGGQALGADGGPNAAPRQLGVDALEVAILDRTRALPRKFRRITGDRLAALLQDDVEPDDPGTEAPTQIPPEPTVPRPWSARAATQVDAVRAAGTEPVTVAAPVAVVVGTGLIGASVGCALTAAGYAVHLQDRQSSHARVAAGLGAGTVEPAGPGRCRTWSSSPCRRTRSPGRGGQSLEAYPRATVTDVGSVKAGVLDALWRRAVDLTRYVGSHPMAGSQHSGPDDRPGRPVRRPHLGGHAAPPLRRRLGGPVVQAAVRACGARPVVMDVDDHDAAVARVSHLPHLLSVLMAGHLTTVPEGDLVLAGPGAARRHPGGGQRPRAVGADRRRQLRRGAERAARRPGPAGPAGQGRGGDAGRRGAARPAASAGWPGRARSRASTAPRRWRTARSSWRSPTSPARWPGCSARSRTAGVNVEDIAIEHDPVREVGYLALSVAPEASDDLVARMVAHGWSVV